MAGKLNKRCHTVALLSRFMSAKALELCTHLGVAPAWSTPSKRAVKSCPLKCSCIILLAALLQDNQPPIWAEEERGEIKHACACFCEGWSLQVWGTWHKWTNTQTLMQRRSQDANINGVYFESLHFSSCFCLPNRHIQANKVSQAPYGDSKQWRENKGRLPRLFISFHPPRVAGLEGVRGSWTPIRTVNWWMWLSKTPPLCYSVASPRSL